MKLKRGHVILLPGIVFLVGGIILLGLAITTLLEYRVSIMLDEELFPGESVYQDILVNQEFFEKYNKRGENISVVVDSYPSNIPMNTEIKQPDGTLIIDEVFSDRLITTFSPKREGEYRVTVTNPGIEQKQLQQEEDLAVHVRLESAISSFFTSFETGYSETLVVGYAGHGFLLLSVGIIVIIAGGIVLLIDRIRRTRDQNKAA